MAVLYSPSIVTSNLQICMDWKNIRCYSGTGTTFTNLVPGRSNVGYIKNNVTFSNGILTTNGANSGQQYNVGDRIDINTSASGVDRFGAHNFSIFFWVNQTSSGRIFSTGSAGTGTGNSDNCIWQMWVDTGQFFWWNSGGGSVGSIGASGTWHTPGVWQLIGFTYSYNENGNNVVRCYRDDALAFSNSISTSSHSFIDRSGQSDIQWTLGGGYSSSCFNQNSPCNFGMFMVYNKTLSLQEISQNYNATKKRFGL